jgi:hypothetical protein
MKYIWVLLAITSLVLTACGSPSEPTMNPADVQGTAMAAALTMVAETQAAIPTATPIPPTVAPTATPFPTNTVPPLSLASPTTQLGVAQPTAAIPTNTTAASVGSSDPCNQPLTTWDGETARMHLVNNTKPKGQVVLALGFTTTLGQCGILSASFSNTTTINVPIGTFWASAFVDGKKDFKVFGGDTITRSGSYSLWIENERIILKAGCAPDC